MLLMDDNNTAVKFYMNHNEANGLRPIKPAKYRALPLGNGKFGVYMFCFDDEEGKYDQSGSLISRFAMPYEKALASAEKWQAKEDKSVAAENKKMGFV